MKKRYLALVLVCSLLLGGCSWLDGSYVSIETHHEQPHEGQTEIIFAENYLQLMDAMEALIAAGAETGVIHVPDYTSGSVEAGMSIATAYAMKNSPIGAYAVEDIHYELGTSSGLPAVAVTITYRHSLAEIQRIRRVADVTAAEQIIAETLAECSARVVLLIENYTETDFVLMVEDYASRSPAVVMETPQVSAGIYGTGAARVVELIFTYRNSRDSLRQMKEQVAPVFDAAVLYVSGDGAQRQKYSQLYAFLMERFDYTIETSLTPAYSLLRHGVGDSRAFATVYAAMCRGAGLECMVITGSRSGEPWTWNMVQDNGRYYHVDLLRSSEQGVFQTYTDGDMEGYVWDYSTYPVSQDPVIQENEGTGNSSGQPEKPTTPPETEPGTVPTDPSEPTEPQLPPETTPPTVPSTPTAPTEPEETVPPTIQPPTEPTQPEKPTEPTNPPGETQPSEQPGVPTEPTVPEETK